MIKIGIGINVDDEDVVEILRDLSPGSIVYASLAFAAGVAAGKLLREALAAERSPFSVRLQAKRD